MSIYDQVLSFICEPDATRFEALAVEVFRHQIETVESYREYCRRLGLSLEDIITLNDIPAMSTVAFKYASIRQDCHDRGERIFLTSGTTVGGDGRGTHVVARPDIYRASAIAHLRRMLFPDAMKMRMLATHPTADRMPQSSLSQMITWCIEEFGTGACACVADHESFDAKAAIDFLVDAERDRAAVCILGTTASLGALFAYMEDKNIRLSLPKRSRIMDTGGPKGQTMPLDPAVVYALAEARLGINSALVINEYGMTELCSQLYDATPFNSNDGSMPGDRIKIAPPWMHAAALNPITLQPVPSGQIGMLRFFDLANVSSVSAILTEDFGTVDGDRVRVLGRMGAAEPRGCALAVREFEAAERALT